MTAYYNENDTFAAQWLRNLIKKGLIADGDVDDRSIIDIEARDVKGYTQCHFFAGIGGWSYALRLAGWPDDRPVWTGSCPCQPFSAAGQRKALKDERHLWPEWFRLIKAAKPQTIFGEQVAAKMVVSKPWPKGTLEGGFFGATKAQLAAEFGGAWLDLVFSDLEAVDYTCGAAVLPACAVGAPHIRQRLWFVADAERGPAERRGHDLAGSPSRVEGKARQRQRIRDDAGPSEQPRELADADGGNASAEGLQRSREQRQQPQDRGVGRMANPSGNRREERKRPSRMAEGKRHSGVASQRSHAEPWADLVWLQCTDGKARPTQSSIQPLAHGIPARMGKLRAAGNAIVPQAAAAFISAFLAINDGH